MNIGNEAVSKITEKELVRRGLEPINVKYYDLYRTPNKGKAGNLIDMSLMDLMGIEIELVRDLATKRYYFVTKSGNAVWKVFHKDVKKNIKDLNSIREIWVSNINTIDVVLSPVLVNNYMLLMDTMEADGSIDKDSAVYFGIFSDLIRKIIKTNIRGLEYSHNELLDMVNTIRLYGLTINSDITWYGDKLETYQDIGPKYLLVTNRDSINTTLLCGIMDMDKIVPMLKHGRQGYTALLPKLVRVIMGDIDYNVCESTFEDNPSIVINDNRYINSVNMSKEIGIHNHVIIKFAKQIIKENPMLLNEMFITPYEINGKMFVSFDMSKKLYLRVLNDFKLDGDAKNISNNIINKAFDTYADAKHNMLTEYDKNHGNKSIIQILSKYGTLSDSVGTKIHTKLENSYNYTTNELINAVSELAKSINKTVTNVCGFDMSDENILTHSSRPSVQNQMNIAIVVMGLINDILDTEVDIDDFCIYLDMLENLK